MQGRQRADCRKENYVRTIRRRHQQVSSSIRKRKPFGPRYDVQSTTEFGIHSTAALYLLPEDTRYVLSNREDFKISLGFFLFCQNKQYSVQAVFLQSRQNPTAFSALMEQRNKASATKMCSGSSVITTGIK